MTQRPAKGQMMGSEEDAADDAHTFHIRCFAALVDYGARSSAPPIASGNSR
jgi:hypothetical protein